MKHLLTGVAIAAALAISAPAWAQNAPMKPAAAPAFEVASIKPDFPVRIAQNHAAAIASDRNATFATRHKITAASRDETGRYFHSTSLLVLRVTKRFGSVFFDPKPKLVRTIAPASSPSPGA